MKSLHLAAMLFILLALWTGQVNCQPEQVECDFEPIQNGKATNPKKTTYYPGEETSISCYILHDIVGPSRVKCLENGTWTERPTCVPIPPGINIPYGKWVSTGRNTFELRCDDGYRVIGNSTVRWADDGKLLTVGEFFPVCMIDCSMNTKEEDNKERIDCPMCPKKEDNNVWVALTISLGVACFLLVIALVITCITCWVCVIKPKSKSILRETDEHAQNASDNSAVGVDVREPTEPIPEGEYPPNARQERAETETSLILQATQEEEVVCAFELRPRF